MFDSEEVGKKLNEQNFHKKKGSFDFRSAFTSKDCFLSGISSRGFQ